MARLSALDDARQVLLQFVGRQRPQRIVAAQRHDQHAHVAIESPVEPRETAGRGVTRDAGVHDLVVEPVLVEPLLQERWICLVGRQTKARGQAVTQRHNPWLCGSLRLLRDGRLLLGLDGRGRRVHSRAARGDRQRRGEREDGCGLPEHHSQNSMLLRCRTRPISSRAGPRSRWRRNMLTCSAAFTFHLVQSARACGQTLRTPSGQPPRCGAASRRPGAPNPMFRPSSPIGWAGSIPQP